MIEVLNDRKNDSAVIKLTFYFEPVEPFYSEICAAHRGDCQCDPVMEKPVEATAKFKRYDKGWRIEDVIESKN